MSKIRFVGLDVHADTVAVAVAEPDGEVLHASGGEYSLRRCFELILEINLPDIKGVTLLYKAY